MRKIVLLISVILMLALVGAVGCNSDDDSSEETSALPTPTPKETPVVIEEPTVITETLTPTPDTPITTNTPASIISPEHTLTETPIDDIDCTLEENCDMSSPDSTVRGYFNAILDKDVARMKSYYSEDYAKMFKFKNFEDLFEYRFSNILIEVSQQDECEAEVKVGYDFQVTFGEEVKSGHTDVIILLIKVDGNWLINGSYRGSSDEKPYAIEWQNVQLAVITLMDDNGVDSFKAQFTWINDLSGDFFEGEHTSLGEYLENADSLMAYYQWNRNGYVYQCKDISCPDGYDSLRV